MKRNEAQEDAVLAVLRELQTIDVSFARAERLRLRCRERTMQEASRRARSPDRTTAWMRVLASAWCLVYLWETLRQAAAVYGL